MKILIVHNYYQLAGGEDDVVANEMALLSDFGHDVQLYSCRNDAIQSLPDKIRTAWGSTYSQFGRRQVAKRIEDYSPDIVHVHNFFPLLSPSIYDACREAGVPVVQTLHNYRLICASGQLTRQGSPCEKCIHGAYGWGVVHKCYRESMLGSFFVARMLSHHRKRKTWVEKVDCFITPSHFMKRKFMEAELPMAEVRVKPNFVPEAQEMESSAGAPERSGALFAARLSQEKGVGTLLDAWQGLDVPLRLLGDGPMMEYVQEKAVPAIDVMGWQPVASLIDEMRRAAFLIMPSTWYEGFPVTLVLALSNGLPIIASRLGAMEEVVEDGKTGLLFTPGDAADLAEKVAWAADNMDRMREMSANARSVYEEKYSAKANYENLMDIYKSAMNAANGPHARASEQI
ncbi:MAG: glycosyltransferase [Alphaproteobacteria bacterium]|nr:glycosyltransferase [Alphaproteobacteria bacterium]